MINCTAIQQQQQMLWGVTKISYLHRSQLLIILTHQMVKNQIQLQTQSSNYLPGLL